MSSSDCMKWMISLCFQNICDLVKPLKKVRPSSDEEIKKYKFYFDKDIDNTLRLRKMVYGFAGSG